MYYLAIPRQYINQSSTANHVLSFSQDNIQDTQIETWIISPYKEANKDFVTIIVAGSCAIGWHSEKSGNVDTWTNGQGAVASKEECLAVCGRIGGINGAMFWRRVASNLTSAENK